MSGDANGKEPTDRWSPASLRDFIRERVKDNPRATARELFVMAAAVRVVTISLESFAPEVSKIRKELGIQVTSSGRGAQQRVRTTAPAKPAAPVAPPIAAPPTVESRPEPVHVEPVVRLRAVAPPTPSTAPVVLGIVAFAVHGDSFKATQRDDGGWDVELRACVDDDLMGRLAGVMFERVVGAGRDQS